MTEPMQDAQPVTTVAVACDSRKPWQSKTMWASAIVAVLPLIPGVGPAVSTYLSVNPQVLMPVIGAVFAILRLISDGKVALK